VRLITRNDTSLAMALIASTVILFQQPLRYIFDIAKDIEARYHVDLVPALVLLVVVFGFHEYQKRAQAKAEARAAAAEAAQARMRSQELEQLMAFSQALANSLDQSNLQQMLWKFLPTFAHNRPFWVMAYRGNGWEPLVHDGWTVESLERLATQVLTPDALRQAARGNEADAAELHLPLMAGGAPVGVIGISNLPAMSEEERKAWGAAAAVLAIGVRNMQLFSQTREQSLRDALTGCFNRAHAVETLANEIRRARRTSRPLSILMFDIDHFKTINDRLGHLRGDELLHGVGIELSKVLRTTDVRCRYGGDEFLVVLPETPLVGAEQVAESIRREIGAIAVTSGDTTVPISVSMGVAMATVNDRSPEALIERADKALYESKKQGRNRVSVAPASTSALALVKNEEPAELAGSA